MPRSGRHRSGAPAAIKHELARDFVVLGSGGEHGGDGWKVMSLSRAERLAGGLKTVRLW